MLALCLAACEEPYFDKPFTKGEKLTSIPAELQGSYNILVRDAKNGKAAYDTVKEEFVYITPEIIAYIKEGTDTAGIYEDDILFDVRKDECSLYKIGNVYYLNEAVEESDTAYYAVRQLKPSKNGLEHRFLDMDNDLLMEKLGKAMPLIKQKKYTGNGNKEQMMVFKMDEDKLHRFFEKEVQDTLVVNLLRVKQ